MADKWGEFEQHIRAAPSLAALADVLRAMLSELNAAALPPVKSTCKECNLPDPGVGDVWFCPCGKSSRMKRLPGAFRLVPVDSGGKERGNG